MNNELFDSFETITTETLEFNENDIEEKFNIVKLELFEDEALKINSFFSDNIWKCRNLQTNFTRNITFFTEMEINKGNSLQKKNQLSLKAWAISQLESRYSLEFIAKKISIVKQALTESEFFKPDKFEQFKEVMFPPQLSKKLKYFRALAINEYLSYTEYSVDYKYVIFVIETHQLNIDVKNTIRTIPSSKDTLKFSLIVEDYFKHNKSLKYFPIYLWWNLTNIIPLRIGEFCAIRQNCIEHSDGEYFITLPRAKNRLSNELVWDSLWIPSDLAKAILDYINETKRFGFSKTLLHYVATKYDSISDKVMTRSKDEYLNSFVVYNFDSLLTKFYSEIVRDLYGFEILEDNNSVINSEGKFMVRRIRPNDTRHFAFLNLLLQGYDPPEIARLGGHKSIYSQYSYHQHLEYWVDSDLINLLLSNNYMLNNITNNFFQKIIFKKSIFNPALVSYPGAHKLEIGICIDPNQKCEVDEHYQCKYWRITEVDYNKHQEKIHSFINVQEDLLKASINKLLDLHKTSIFSSKDIQSSDDNKPSKKLISSQAQKVKQALFQLIQLRENITEYTKPYNQ